MVLCSSDLKFFNRGQLGQRGLSEGQTSKKSQGAETAVTHGDFERQAEEMNKQRDEDGGADLRASQDKAARIYALHSR